MLIILFFFMHLNNLSRRRWEPNPAFPNGLSDVDNIGVCDLMFYINPSFGHVGDSWF